MGVDNEGGGLLFDLETGFFFFFLIWMAGTLLLIIIIFIICCCSFAVFVSPALAGKTNWDHFVLCCLLLSLLKRVNIWLYLPYALMNFYQSKIIDEAWNLQLLMRSKVIWGQFVREFKNVSVASFENLRTWFIDTIQDPLFMQLKVKL